MRPTSWGEAGALEEGAQTRRHVEHVSGVPGGRAWADLVVQKEVALPVSGWQPRE